MLDHRIIVDGLARAVTFKSEMAKCHYHCDQNLRDLLASTRSQTGLLVLHLFFSRHVSKVPKQYCKFLCSFDFELVPISILWSVVFFENSILDKQYQVRSSLGQPAPR